MLCYIISLWEFSMISMHASWSFRLVSAHACHQELLRFWNSQRYKVLVEKVLSSERNVLLWFQRIHLEVTDVFVRNERKWIDLLSSSKPLASPPPSSMTERKRTQVNHFYHLDDTPTSYSELRPSRVSAQSTRYDFSWYIKNENRQLRDQETRNDRKGEDWQRKGEI